MHWSTSLPLTACVLAFTVAGCTDTTTGRIAKIDSPANDQTHLSLNIDDGHQYIAGSASCSDGQQQRDEF